VADWLGVVTAHLGQSSRPLESWLHALAGAGVPVVVRAGTHDAIEETTSLFSIGSVVATLMG
jgi:hypothetical protein